ncbi:hypothetical protein [Mycetocola reblochoni]|nr:hypothetical protein [Mycetocola reblochoni]
MVFMLFVGVGAGLVGSVSWAGFGGAQFVGVLLLVGVTVWGWVR